MSHKRRPTDHQKQIRLLAILFAVVMILVVIGTMLLLNRPMGGYFH